MAIVLSQQCEQMNQDIRTLGTKLSLAAVNSAVVHRIPSTPKGRENDPVNTIVLAEHTGKSATEAAVHAYQDLHIRPNDSQKVARRAVGALWLPLHHNPVAHEIPDLVRRINTAKSNIEQHIIQTYETRQERFEALRAACPGVMTLHLYRQIRCFHREEVVSVRFSWQRKDALVTPDKPELMRRIAEEMEHSGVAAHVSLNPLLMAISATPEHQLRLRRPVRVQPVANIRTDRETKTVTAPMPILILQDSDLLIKPLADFDASVRRKARSDRSLSVVLGTFAGVTIEALSGEPRRPECASLQPSGF